MALEFKDIWIGLGPLVLGLALVLTGCSSAQPTYSYPGCEDAGIGAPCEPSPVFVCAEGKITQKYNRCTQDGDCVLVSVGLSCVFAPCEISVRADQVGQFRDELLNEDQSYCAIATANGPTCGGGDAFACGFSNQPFCDAGTCDQAPAPLDAGPLGD